jgi:transposase InsO family protein
LSSLVDVPSQLLTIEVLRRPIESAQYTSGQFAQFCTDNRVRTSVGRTGVCWDNAAAESVFAALKRDLPRSGDHVAAASNAMETRRPALTLSSPKAPGDVVSA